MLAFHIHSFSLPELQTCNLRFQIRWSYPQKLHSQLSYTLCSSPCFLSKLSHHSLSITSTTSSPKLNSLLLFFTFIALSLSSFIGNVGSASAFVVTSPRKLQSDELATVRLFQENTPSVVYITNLSAKQDAFTLDVMEVPQGSGSGFIWDTEGCIVTNYHVIRAASDLGVTLAYQTTYDAKVVDFDQDKDVAVLRVDAPKDKLRPIPIGVSNDLLVGQKVYAIGNPRTSPRN